MDHLRYYAALRKLNEEIGLNQRQMVTLLIVNRDGRRTVGYLLHLVGGLPTQMSRTLNTLEEKGLIAREFGKDRRCVHVTITKPGEKVAKKCLEELDVAASFGREVVA